jgi:hypothetical protein
VLPETATRWIYHGCIRSEENRTLEASLSATPGYVAERLTFIAAPVMNDSSRTFVRSTTSTASASASVSAPAPAPASAYRPFPPMLHQLDEDISDQDIDDDSSERQVRRRSSKACDQCRKNKCKCERNATVGEPCKNCVILGTGQRDFESSVWPC